MDRSLVGDWSAGFREFTIAEDSGELWMRCPAAPPGFEARLVDVAPDRVLIEGGPLHGAEIVIGATGDITLGGHLSMERLDRPAEPPPGWGLIPPIDEPEEDEVESFQHLWTWLAHPSKADEVDLGACDLTRFLRWLGHNRLALFHGTGRLDLDRLAPAAWPTVSIGDPGADRFVYASADALCSMFLAIVDHEATGRSGIHWMERFRSLDGEELEIYQFSLSESGISNPLRAGGIYLLPKEGFTPLSLYPGGPLSYEWISLEPVRPLACLIATPDDFPFRDQLASPA